jgi:hypothetical protein
LGTCCPRFQVSNPSAGSPAREAVEGGNFASPRPRGLEITPHFQPSPSNTLTLLRYYPTYHRLVIIRGIREWVRWPSFLPIIIGRSRGISSRRQAQMRGPLGRKFRLFAPKRAGFFRGPRPSGLRNLFVSARFQTRVIKIGLLGGFIIVKVP